MNKLFLLLLVLCVYPVVASAQSSNWYATQTQLQQAQGGGASAQTNIQNGNINYAPLEPLSQYDTKAGSYGNFSYYLNTIFRLLLTLGSMFAVVLLVYGGVAYMVSEAASGIDKAKKQIVSALWGLALLAGAWLILYTINPQLLVFNLNPKSIVGGGSQQAPQQNTLPWPASQDTQKINSPYFVGTANGDQLRQTSEKLGLKNYLPSDQYLLFDPSLLGSNSETQKAYDGYRDFCEKSGIIYNASLGTLHYNVKAAPGELFGAPNKTALVCTDN